MIFLFILFLLLSFSGVEAETFFLYGNRTGDPILCEGIKLKVVVTENLPELQEDFSVSSPDGRVIYEGVCPAGPIAFSAKENDYLVVTLSSQFQYPIVKHDRVIRSQQISFSGLKLCSTRNCSRILSPLTLNAPFYTDFLTLAFKIGKESHFKPFELSSSDVERRPPYIDDSYLLQAEKEDFLLILEAADGIPDNFPLLIYMPSETEIKFLGFSLLGKGALDPLYFCSETNCTPLLSTQTSLMNFFDESDLRFVTAFLSDNEKPSGYFYGFPDEQFFFVAEKNLVNIFVQGDNFYFTSEGWRPEKEEINIEENEYPLGRIREELKFLAAGLHHLSIFNEEKELVGFDFFIPDNDDFEPLEINENSDPNPASLLTEKYQKLLTSIEAENVIINNSVPGRKLGEFNLHVGDPGEGAERIVKRWCDVYEPSLFEWVHPVLHGFFYLAYLDKNIADLTGSIILRCYEKIEREKEDEEGNTSTETFVQIISPPENIDTLFILKDDNGTTYSFRGLNRTMLGEGTVSLWFQNRMYVEETRRYRSEVRIIVQETTTHSLVYEGRNITIGPSPISIVGIDNEKGFNLQDVGTSSSFPALSLNIGLKIRQEEEVNRIPPVKLLLVISRSNNISMAEAETFYEFPFINGVCRRRIVINRTFSDPETVAIRFLAIDNKGVIYPGPVVNRAYIFKLPDSEAPAVLVLSTPEEVSPGQRLTIEAFLDVLSPLPFNYSLKLGFYKVNRGWIWIKDVINGHPVATFNKQPYQRNFYTDKRVKIDVNLPDVEEFWTFTLLGSYVVYGEITDVLTGQVVSNTASIIRILP